MIPGICTWSLSRFCGSEVLLDSLLYTRLNTRPCPLKMFNPALHQLILYTMALRPITINSDTLQAHSPSMRVFRNRDSHFPQWNNPFQFLHNISMHGITAESLNPDFSPGRTSTGQNRLTPRGSKQSLSYFEKSQHNI